MDAPKVLLTSPFMSYKDRWGQYYEGAGDTFPQGIGFIAGYIEAHGLTVSVIEPDVTGMTLEKYTEFVRSGGFDIAGISAFTTNIVKAYNTACLIKSADPSIKVVLGGSHPTIFPIRTLEECPDVDFVITHEGEEPFYNLVTALRSGAGLDSIPNLYYRSDGEIKATGIAAEWIDLDRLPMFPYHMFDVNRYIPAPSLRRNLPTFNYMAQRGCPFKCSFCDTTSHGGKVRHRSVEKVTEDLEYLKERYGLKGVIFEGSNFTINSRWMEKLCARMIDRKMGLEWYCMGRADLHEDLFPLMKRAGLWRMSFGIESGNDRTLERMQKKITTDRVQRTLRSARAQGIDTIGSFILGYPGEDEHDVLDTIKYACDLDLDVAVFFIPVPFPNTSLYDDALADGGLKKDLAWEDYSAWLDHNNPIYTNPLIGAVNHKRLYNYAFRKFYVRPRYIAKQIGSMRRIKDILRLIQGFKSVKGLIAKSLRKS
jgi:radical SAM superfamily enzyme YgiQ (UPF0313 family)